MSGLSVDITREQAGFTLSTAFVCDGGLTALFGPSGSGKSMTLNAIAGIIKPQGGTITLAGETLFDAEANIALAPEKRRIAYVFQEPRLFPHMTVEANLFYGVRFQPDDAPQVNAADVIKVLGIESLLDRKTHGLSGGEAQRVAIGRALMTSPRLILMDEPLANLDPARRLDLMPFIEELRDQFQIPIIYVSHSLEEVIRLADQVVLLNQGAQIAEGPAGDLLTRAEVQPLLGLTDRERRSSAPIAVLDGKLVEHDQAFALSRLHARGLDFWMPRLERPIGARLRLQVRASDVALARLEPTDTSILNRFPGTITTLDTSHPGFADVEIECAGGTPLWARITQKSAVKLNLETGQEIWAMVKSVAIAEGLPDPVDQPVSRQRET